MSKPTKLQPEDWFDAVAAGDVRAINSFIRAGFPINKRNAANDLHPTALQLATYLGHVEVMKVLVAARAKLDCAHGTLLGYAIAGGHLGATKLVLNLGVPLNKANENGITPLMQAIANKKEEISIEILERGGNPRTKNCFGQTALHIAAEKGLVEFFKRLMAINCDPSITDSDQRTPLILAAKRGHLEIVKILLRCFNKIQQDELNRALAEAASNSHYEVARLLLEIGATFDWKSDFGVTALDWAASDECLPLLSLFLRSGLIQSKSKMVIRAKASAREEGHKRAVAVLDKFIRSGKAPLFRKVIPKTPKLPEWVSEFAGTVDGTASAAKGANDTYKIKLKRRGGKGIVDREQDRLRVPESFFFTTLSMTRCFLCRGGTNMKLFRKLAQSEMAWGQAISSSG